MELARAGGYGLIVMDIMMPELDGFSAAREIRKTSDVPLIFLSARGRCVSETGAKGRLSFAPFCYAFSSVSEVRGISNQKAVSYTHLRWRSPRSADDHRRLSA